MTHDRPLRRPKPLLHPFDDPVFAAMATEAGLSRDDLPTEYDPSMEWGNDGITTDLPGLPGFSFFAGDDSYHGRLRLDLDAMSPVVYEHDRSIRRIGVPMVFPEMLAAAIIGGPLSRVVELKHFTGATVEAIEPDDDEGSWLTIRKD